MSSVLRLENRHTGEVLQLSRFLEGGVECVRLVGSSPAESDGPPLHAHFLEDEFGTIRKGVLHGIIGDRRVEARAGESVTLPKGIPHRWWNGGDVTLEFDGFARPGLDVDKYLQAAFEIANASPTGRPSLFYFAHMAVRHRRTHLVLVIPPLVQAVLFPLVVAVGTLLGKYRGTAWPGCPARCTGAPRE